MTPGISTGRAQPSEPYPVAEIGNLPITVLMNASSGSADKSAARMAVDTILRAAGRNVELLLARRPRDLPMLAQQAAATRPGILVAAGGDGTLNAVASAAHARGLPFAVIPLGTFNYFARNLDIPLDSASAARVIIEGRVRRVPIGQVNGRLFLNNASIGLYRRLIEHRELHKKRFGRNRVVALLSGLATLLREHRVYLLHLEIDGQSLTLSSLMVFFGRNALQMEHLGLDEALCVARGELAVLALREVDRLELLGLALRGALARLETAQNLRQYCALKVQVDWLDGRDRRIRVAVDGELVECTLPLVIETVPDALQVIVPRQPETNR
ncbi:MAG TPA: diacylglycerol kinase family protein [Noviherbaspirillum sp.]